MRVLFCGGGTAGHVNPAIAMAQTVMRNSSENKIAYVATENGIENELVDFKKYHIDVIGLKKRLSFGTIKFLKKQMMAVEKCKEIIKEFRPDVVFGTGGYATYPVIIAARKMGVKTILHESNVIPGKAIKALEKKADKILVNFEESKSYFKDKSKIVRTGNPLRRGFEIYKKEKARKELGITAKNVILCISGSLGAKRINDAAIEMIDNLVKHQNETYFVWSTGKNEYSRVKDILENKGFNRLKNVVVSDYFQNIPQIMAAADVVISRAGAMTISELASMSKAAILIPSPNVTNNHQFLNAKALDDSLSAIMITEDRLYTLIDMTRELLTNEEKRKKYEQNISEYSLKNANRTIFGIIESII